MMKIKSRAFTLIETLVYAGIISGFLTISLILVYQMINYSNALKNQRELGENQRFLIQKLEWVLSSVQAVNAPALGATSTSLSVNKIGFGQNPLTVNLSGGTVTLSNSATSSVALNNGYVTVSNLLFSNLNLSRQNTVEVTATLSNGATSTPIDALIVVKL